MITTKEIETMTALILLELALDELKDAIDDALNAIESNKCFLNLN